VSYKVLVTTGDRKGAGTDGNVLDGSLTKLSLKVEEERDGTTLVENGLLLMKMIN